MDLRDFDDIRPFTDWELSDKLNQLISDQQFMSFAEKIFDKNTLNSLCNSIDSFRSITQFQYIVINPLLDKIISKHATSFNSYGFTDNQPAIYISNHRDIVLDSALLDKILIDSNKETVEIGIGNNLLIYPWIETLVRLNKAFIVKRGESGKELIQNSKHMSEYIHYVITSKGQSIWLAQREGRAKDSNDTTQESVLKMLALGSNKSFIDSLLELNLRPLAISYEYDPCDYLKAQEFQLKRDNSNYKKSQADDLVNMKVGINGYKGRITYKCSSSINETIKAIAKQTSNRNEQATLIAQAIDKEIYSNYCIYTINYIAYDLLNNSHKFSDKYGENEVFEFKAYLNQQLEKINIPNKDNMFLQHKLLEIYSNPLINQLKEL